MLQNIILGIHLLGRVIYEEKKLPIIFESFEDEYKSLNQKLAHCTNNNYCIYSIFCYKI